MPGFRIPSRKKANVMKYYCYIIFEIVSAKFPFLGSAKKLSRLVLKVASTSVTSQSAIDVSSASNLRGYQSDLGKCRSESR